MIRYLFIVLTSSIMAACGSPNQDTPSSSSSSSSSPTSSSSSSSSSSTSSSSSSSGQVDEPQARCEDSITQQNKQAALAAMEGFFIQKNTSVVDQYWSTAYLQHNPLAQSGISAFKSFMLGFVTSGSFNYEIIRTFGECDLVVVQGKYSGSGVIFDMFRLEDGKLAEHWDSDSNQASGTAGPTQVEDREATHRNRETIEDLYNELIAGNTNAADDYFSNAVTIRASSSLSGSSAFTQYMSNSKITYSKVHHMIADGNFVFALVEGKQNNNAYAFYDLFRLQDGLVVEHWNSKRSVPSSTASGLGIF